MIIKRVEVFIVKDSRNQDTIKVEVNGCGTIAPSGKSTGKFEKKSYIHNLREDVDSLRGEMTRRLPEIKYFNDLEKIEKIFKNKIGANSLFALEASILKALAKENGKELWNFLNPKAKKIPTILSNTIGGGAHSSVEKNSTKPEFQEFLVCCDAKKVSEQKKILQRVHETAGKVLSRFENKTIEKNDENVSFRKRSVSKKTLSWEESVNKETERNDENAWKTSLSNGAVLEILKEMRIIFAKEKIKLNIGLDVAASQFYNRGKYEYKNGEKFLSRKEQIEYISWLIKKYNLIYVEDPLDEEDFSGFNELKKKSGSCLIVGDDLTVTNFKRTEKAIKNKSINAMVIKPNQIGSLLEVKKVIDLCKKNKIKTIISHRSGETIDDTIADLGVAWECDFIKTPVVGKERLAKVERLKEIEQRFQ